MRTLKPRDTLKRWMARFNELVQDDGALTDFAVDYDFVDGLTFFVRWGVFRRGTLPVIIPDTFVTLPNNATSIVYLNIGTESIQSSLAANIPANGKALYRVTTASGVITNVVDVRSTMFDPLSHSSLVNNLNAVDAHPQYELKKAVGNLLDPLMFLPLKKADDAVKLQGDFQYLCESNVTYIDPRGKLVKAEYYAGNSSASDAVSIEDTTKNFSSLDGYIAYLTDGLNVAYRWVKVNDATKVVWTKPVGFTVASYKLSKPRFERNGLLLEGPSANLLKYSEDLTNAVWVGGNAKTANVELAPDGSLTADSVTFSGVGQLYQIATVTPGNKYTFSYYVKLGSKTNNRYAVYDHTNSAFIVESTVSAGVSADKWSRVFVTFTAPASCTAVRCYVDIADDLNELGNNYIWGAQCEAKPFATSYIPTAATAASRLQTFAHVQIRENLPKEKTNIAAIIDFDVLGVDAIIEQTIYGLSDSIYFQYWMSKIVGDELRQFYDGIGNASGNIMRGESYRAGATLTATGTLASYLNGDAIETRSGLLPAQDLAWHQGRIQLGAYHGSTNPLYGHVSNLKIYDSVLSADEMRMA